MSEAPRLTLAAAAFWAVMTAGLGLYVAHTALGLGSGPLWDSYGYCALIGGSATACLARARAVRHERAAWVVMGVGLLAWMGGELWWTLVPDSPADVPVPSLADGLYFVYYACAYVTIVLLLRGRTRSFRASLWLDGAIAAFGVGAVLGALVFQPIVDATVGDPVTVAVNLFYPSADLLLLSLVVASFALSGWRPDRAWLFIGAGLGLSAVGDGIYLFQSANGTYVEGTFLDALWPAATLLIGVAAWQRPRRRSQPRIEGWRVIAIPSVCGLAALGVLTWDHFERLNNGALVLSSLTIVLVTVRLVLMFRENQAMLRQTRAEALTDALTGLSNRRSLMVDLADGLRDATLERPRALVLFDLDGFKHYNDTFGHLAGDELLARLGGRLAGMAAGHGTAYRLGGDEFCVFMQVGETDLEPMVAACSAALSDRGDGFSITASHGSVVAPVDAVTPTEVLQLADRRMYARKGGRRNSAGRQSRDVLLSTLSERQPDLHLHLRDVAALATGVGRELGMSYEELDEVARAAELHDVGKVAVPDAILNKPGPLDPAEWSFMRRHTIIGERILLAAPALRPVGKLVRSSHERWNGTGYPDGLAGEEIPLGARIVSVCDAFDAMTTNRPYRARLSDVEALGELRACAGTQFDPRVVEAFVRALDALRGPIAGSTERVA